MTPGEVLALSDDHDRQLALRKEAYREGWAACLDEIADIIGGRVYPAALSDLEKRRWGPLGRAHFADPRPGDHPGEESA